LRNPRISHFKALKVSSPLPLRLNFFSHNDSSPPEKRKQIRLLDGICGGKLNCDIKVISYSLISSPLERISSEKCVCLTVRPSFFEPAKNVPPLDRCLLGFFSRPSPFNKPFPPQTFPHSGKRHVGKGKRRKWRALAHSQRMAGLFFVRWEALFSDLFSPVSYILAPFTLFCLGNPLSDPRKVAKNALSLSSLLFAASKYCCPPFRIFGSLFSAERDLFLPRHFVSQTFHPRDISLTGEEWRSGKWRYILPKRPIIISCFFPPFPGRMRRPRPSRVKRKIGFAANARTHRQGKEWTVIFQPQKCP